MIWANWLGTVIIEAPDVPESRLACHGSGYGWPFKLNWNAVIYEDNSESKLVATAMYSREYTVKALLLNLAPNLFILAGIAIVLERWLLIRPRSLDGRKPPSN